VTAEVLDENQRRLDARVSTQGRDALDVPSLEVMAEQCGLRDLLGVSGAWLRWMYQTDSRSLVVEVLGHSTKELFVVLYDGGRATGGTRPGSRSGAAGRLVACGVGIRTGYLMVAFYLRRAERPCCRLEGTDSPASTDAIRQGCENRALGNDNDPVGHQVRDNG